MRTCIMIILCFSPSQLPLPLKPHFNRMDDDCDVLPGEKGERIRVPSPESSSCYRTLL